MPPVVDTLGGRMHVRWDEDAAATPHGPLVFVADFLAASGVFECWASSGQLTCRSGNAPDKRDMPGALMLGVPAGHRPDAHQRERLFAPSSPRLAHPLPADR